MQRVNLHGPPGTGKTRRMVEEARRLLESGVRPERLGFFSFTKAAAYEGGGRLVRELGLEPDQLRQVGTLHSIAFALLEVKREQKVGPKALKPFFDALKVAYAGRNGRGSEDLFDETADDDPSLGGACLRIWDWARSLLLPMADERDFERALARYLRGGGRVPRDDYWGALAALTAFIPEYEDWKRQTGLWDFPGLLVDVLARDLAPPIDALLLDEAQDLSPLQCKVARRWERGLRESWWAGDPYQAIYGFQGASPDLFKGRPGDWERLTVSHRLTPEQARYVHETLCRGGSVEPFELVGRHDGVPRGQTEFWLGRTGLIVEQHAAALMGAGRPFRAERGGLDPIGTKEARAVRAALVLGRDGEIPLRDLGAMLGAVPSSRAESGWIAWGAKRHLERELARLGSQHRVRLDALVDEWMVGPRLAERIADGRPWDAFERLEADKRDYYRRVAETHGPDALVDEPSLVLTTMHGSKGREADYVTFCADWATRPYFALVREDRAGEHRVAYVGLSRPKGVLNIVRPTNRRLFPLPEPRGGM